MSTQPTEHEVNGVLSKLDKPQWKSDAERLHLPLVNIHDTGAPLLQTDDILRRSYPNHAQEK